MKKLILLAMACVMALGANAQFYTGMSGLMHVPSAEMEQEGDLRIGTYFLNKHFTPQGGFANDDGRYNTMDFYISATPFWWVEVGYAFTLLKDLHPGYEKPRYNAKDRYLSIKFTPIREGKYVPAVSVGSNDFLSTFTRSKSTNYHGSGKSEYFRNYFIAVTKHLRTRGQEFGATLAYRKFTGDENHRWNGVVGGLTYRPGFAPDGRLMAEWDGCRVNLGVDYTLWNHLCLEAMLVDCRYFSGGIAYKVNLF